MRQKQRRQRDQNVGSSQVVKSIYFNHPSQGNSTNYYIILGPRDKAAPPTSQQINKFPPKRVNYLAIPSTILFLPFFFIHRRAPRSQPIRGKVRRIGRIFAEHVERSFLDPEYSFVAGERRTRTIFAKQLLAQLKPVLNWTNVNVRRSGRMFPEHVERSFLDHKYSFVAVRRILLTRSAKLKFAQLRTI